MSSVAINIFAEGVCPDSCDDGTVLLPPIEEDQNCQEGKYNAQLSQICDLYIKPDKVTTVPASFSTADMATYLTAEVDNTNTDNTKIKWIVGEGGIPIAEKSTKEVAKNGVITTKRTYTFTYKITNLTPNMYDFLRRIQCGWKGFVFNYATVGGCMFGNDNGGTPNLCVGICPQTVDANIPLDAGREDTKYGEIIITFCSDVDPARIDDPFQS